MLNFDDYSMFGYIFWTMWSTHLWIFTLTWIIVFVHSPWYLNVICKCPFSMICYLYAFVWAIWFQYPWVVICNAFYVLCPMPLCLVCAMPYMCYICLVCIMLYALFLSYLVCSMPYSMCYALYLLCDMPCMCYALCLVCAMSCMCYA